MTPHKHYEPEPPPPRPATGLIQLAGGNLNDQCINLIDKKQCGRRKRPGSNFCSPKCQGIHNRANPHNKLT